MLVKPVVHPATRQAYILELFYQRRNVKARTLWADRVSRRDWAAMYCMGGEL